MPADIKGVVVTQVTPGGPSWESLADERRGGPDIILSVEAKPVTSPSELKSALEGQAGSVVTLRVYNPRSQTKRIERVKLSG